MKFELRIYFRFFHLLSQFKYQGIFFSDIRNHRICYTNAKKICYHRLREKKSQKNNRDILEYLESFEIKASSFLSGVGVKIRVDSIIILGFNVNFKIQSFEHTKYFEIIELYLNDSC